MTRVLVTVPASSVSSASSGGYSPSQVTVSIGTAPNAPTAHFQFYYFAANVATVDAVEPPQGSAYGGDVVHLRIPNFPVAALASSIVIDLDNVRVVPSSVVYQGSTAIVSVRTPAFSAIGGTAVGTVYHASDVAEETTVAKFAFRYVAPTLILSQTSSTMAPSPDSLTFAVQLQGLSTAADWHCIIDGTTTRITRVEVVPSSGSAPPFDAITAVTVSVPPATAAGTVVGSLKHATAPALPFTYTYTAVPAGAPPPKSRAASGNSEYYALIVGPLVFAGLLAL